ncbi:hypothetical protein OF001_U100078 [Pseudomonas sp. OF001]|nr:hypothetical protein OF001_U100078 [Pseudomonas sp. OF001]
MGQGHPRAAAARRQLAGVHRERQDRPVPRRGLRVHPQGADHGAAQGLDRGRLRLRGAHRRRQQLHRLPHQPPPGAAVRTAAERRHGGDRHRPRRAAQPGLAQLRGHRQGAYPHPPLAQAAAPLGVGQPRRAPAEQGAGRLRQPPGEARRRAHRRGARRVPARAARRPARGHRPGQPHGLRGGAPPAGRGRQRADARPRGPAGDPRHRGPGDQLRQVLHADPRRPHRRPPVGRQGHGHPPRQLPQHQRIPPQPGQVHPAVLGQGRHRRVQRRAARRAGAPARPDRPAGHRGGQRRRQHREDQHGRARRPHQRGPAGGQRAQPRAPGAGDQAPAHHQGRQPHHPSARLRRPAAARFPNAGRRPRRLPFTARKELP